MTYLSVRAAEFLFALTAGAYRVIGILHWSDCGRLRNPLMNFLLFNAVLPWAGVMLHFETRYAILKERRKR